MGLIGLVIPKDRVMTHFIGVDVANNEKAMMELFALT
jgi:hypothetical protein